MFRHVLKYSVGALIIAGIGFAVLNASRYYESQGDPKQRAIEGYKKVEAQYANDSYGGNTPEETLRLFIEALKAGDTDLAAKYFILDKQEEVRGDLDLMKDKKLIQTLISQLTKAQLTKKGDSAFVTLVDENSVVISQMILEINTKNYRWKITEF